MDESSYIYKKIKIDIINAGILKSKIVLFIMNFT